MPDRDRTGPRGEGPNTGWGSGPCGGKTPKNDRPTGFGRGLGRGGRGGGGWWRGWGRGRGRGGGRGPGRGIGFNWPAPADDIEPEKPEE